MNTGLRTANVDTSSRHRYEVVVTEEAPWVVSSSFQGGKVSYSGLAIDVLERVAQTVGFDYDIRPTQHSSYGYKDIHGNWKGLVSELEGKNAAHLAVGPIPTTSELADNEANVFFSLSKPFMSTGVKLLIKNPPEVERSISVMLDPFAAEVWVMIILAYIVVSLALFLVGHFSPFEWSRLAKERDNRHARKCFDLKNSFLFTASTIGLQGYKEAPRSISGRILMCMWFQFTAFVLFGYVGNLSAILMTRGNTVTRRSVPFRDYKDIIRDQQVKIGAMKYSSLYFLLRSSNVSPYQDLYKYVDQNKEWIQNRQEGVDRVRDSAGRYAFLMDSAKADYVTSRTCDVTTFGEELMSFGYGFATHSAHIQLQKDVNVALLTLRENGVLSMLQRKYFVDDAVCAPPSSPLQYGKESSSAASLDMTDMAIPFLFLFLGLLATAAAMAGEVYYTEKIQKKPKKSHSDQKVREAQATDVGVGGGGGGRIRESPPPPPIYKGNNKENTTGANGGRGSSIEMVVVNEGRGQGDPAGTDVEKERLTKDDEDEEMKAGEEEEKPFEVESKEIV